MGNQLQQFFTSILIMNQVLFHFKPEYLANIIAKGLDYTHSKLDEIDVIVPDIEYDPNHYCVDPDVQLCEKYGFNYDQVNCIELVS